MRLPQDSLNKPTWNLYDLTDNPDHQLAESLVAEFTDITGIACTYYRRDPSVPPDQLYGETQNAEYLEGKETKIIYDVGDVPTVYSMFGMLATDSIIAHIPQSVYRRDVDPTDPDSANSSTIPLVGDAIYIPYFSRSFEVLHVAQDDKIFMLKSLIWVLNLKPFRYSEESESAAGVSSNITTETPSITAFGDNEYIEEQSVAIDTYSDVDTKIYGY